MKTWKQGIIGIVAIIVLAVTLTACNDKPDPGTDPQCDCTVKVHYNDEMPCCNGTDCTCTSIPRPVPCTCDPKEHYLPCTCGGTDCICTVIPRGYITEKDTNIQIPIYQSVENEQAAATVTAIKDGYALLNDSRRNALKGKIEKVVMVADGADFAFEVANGKLIFKIKFGRTDTQIRIHFLEFMQDDFPGLDL